MSSSRKPRLTFSLEQRLDYAKLMVDENYTIKQVMEISGAGQTAVNRWKNQYLKLKGSDPFKGELTKDMHRLRNDGEGNQ